MSDEACEFVLRIVVVSLHDPLVELFESEFDRSEGAEVGLEHPFEEACQKLWSVEESYFARRLRHARSEFVENFEVSISHRDDPLLRNETIDLCGFGVTVLFRRREGRCMKVGLEVAEKGCPSSLSSRVVVSELSSSNSPR